MTTWANYYPFIINGLLFILLFYSAFLEFLKKQLPSNFSISVLGLGLIINTLYGGIMVETGPCLVSSLLGILIGCFFFVPMYFLGGLKSDYLLVLMAIGAVKGPKFQLYQFTYSIVACSLLSILILLYHKVFFKGIRGAFSFLAISKKISLDEKLEKGAGLLAPYFIATAIACVYVVIKGI